ncbi:hypothetical protein J6590_099135 [Homalodisca vitripennis]|nr:hypothetical protein J6590_099135 [Homalodisca vitripennis]
MPAIVFMSCLPSTTSLIPARITKQYSGDAVEARRVSAQYPTASRGWPECEVLKGVVHDDGDRTGVATRCRCREGDESLLVYAQRSTYLQLNNACS